MARQQTRGSWLTAIFGFSPSKKQPERRSYWRTLHAECLENRMVLSTAPLADVQGLSLSDYLAEEHALGPTAPTVIVATDLDGMLAANPTPVAMPIALLAGAEGEGDTCTDPNDPTTCTTTTDPGTSTETCTDPNDPTTCSTTDPGTGNNGTETCTDPNDPTTCSTTDPGTGDTGTETCTDSNDPTTCGTTDSSVEDPSVDNATVDTSGGNIVLNGSLTDDGGASNVTMTLDNGAGTIQINDDGTFTVNITDPGDDSVFTITLTDADGNTSTYSFSI